MINGIHHITAIAANAQKNYDFYTDVLGLKLVKKTVNHDDPSVYHLFYRQGNGTTLTFFIYTESPHAPGMLSLIDFAIPKGTMQEWIARTGGEYFSDPDGLRYRLIEKDVAQQQVAGVHLQSISVDETANVLMMMGCNRQDDGHFTIGKHTVSLTHSDYAHAGSGGVHHIAWGVPGRKEQDVLRAQLLQKHLRVSPVIDRVYFSSIYFQEPGNVLFEIATDGPGYGADEKQPGSSLVLPSKLEHLRSEIERILPPLEVRQ